MPRVAEVPPFPDDVDKIEMPRISLAKLLEKDQIASEALYEACTDRGIFLLDLTGCSSGQKLLNKSSEMFEVAEQAFDMDDDEKLKFTLNWKNTNGYKSAGMGTVDSNGTPDRCEFYTVGRDDLTCGGAPPQIRPVEQRKEEVLAFMEQSNDLVFTLFDVLESSIRLQPNTLASKHVPSQPSGTQIRMLRFQPQESRDRRTSLVAHTDLGSLTILFNILGGLQILRSLSEPENEKNWAYIRPQPGCAIVNVGDALQKWTNGLLKSPRHRVTYAPGTQATFTRYSVAYFARPYHKTLMTRLGGSDMIPPLGENDIDLPVTAEDWHAKNSAVHRKKVE